MTKEELALLNIGENLDALMNLDPRGYGVCRILYQGSRAYTGEPLTTHSARMLTQNIRPKDIVFIITGFILLPHKVPEMDGMVSSLLLARSLVQAFDAKPVIICPEDCLEAIKKCAGSVGLHCYEDLKQVEALPLSVGVIAFTKDKTEAAEQAERIMEQVLPKAVIAVEAPGANENGEYHNAVGVNVTALEAKTDILFMKLKNRGILNIAIGDLGNEIGMGTIGDHIRKYIPYTSQEQCKCDCEGGTLSEAKADHIITATVSDWGCYGLMAALAYLKKDITIFHDSGLQREVMRAVSGCGIVDMTGSLLPGIDGFSMSMNITIVDLMRQCTEYAIQYEGNGGHWFEQVLAKGFFSREADRNGV